MGREPSTRASLLLLKAEFQQQVPSFVGIFYLTEVHLLSKVPQEAMQILLGALWELAFTKVFF